MIRKPIFSMAVVFASAVSLCAWLPAQETTTTTTVPKSQVMVMTIDTAQVVYVSGDDVVLRLPNGGLRLLTLQPGSSLIVDGRPAKVSDLTPGTTVSNVKVNSRVESEVTTVTQINGTVTAKNGPFVTLRLEDGTAKIYRVPPHATFTVDGKTADYGAITKGMKISATVVKTEGLTTHTTDTALVAQTPPQLGTLLIVR